MTLDQDLLRLCYLSGQVEAWAAVEHVERGEMKVTQLTRDKLAFRRQEADLLAMGYRRHETDWEINRGFQTDKVIIDAIISINGKYVYTKIGAPDKAAMDAKKGNE